MRRQIVPEHSRILEISLWVPFLSVNELHQVSTNLSSALMPGDAHNRKLAWISQEEDWCVVEDPIPVTLIGIELDREATRIPRAIGRTLLASNGGEACNTLRLLANFRQHINRRLN